MALRINPELEAFIPALKPEEFEALKASVISTGGPTDPLRVWLAPDGTRTLLDGHNRLRICEMFGLPVRTIDVPLPNLDAAKTWMIEFQRGRRNLTKDQQLAIDVRAGRPSDDTPLRVGSMKALFEKHPMFFERVLNGELGLMAAANDAKRREGAPASVTPIKQKKGRIHIVIGDTQVKPDVPTAHLGWIGRFIAEKYIGENIAIVHLGDHWDMPSLSSYDEGKRAMEGRRYLADVDAGNKAFELLNAPIEAAMARSKRWRPERHFLFGNHEERVERAANDTAALTGTLTLDDLKTPGWTRHKFLEALVLDGIHYAHYFYAPGTGRPYGGENLHTRLKTIGRSFTQGHQQGLSMAMRSVGTTRHQGLVLGSTYLHEEEYLGPQTTSYWRGIVVCHQVENGTYDPMCISLEWLCRRYEGVTLREYLEKSAAA